jgi:hypothetical protein
MKQDNSRFYMVIDYSVYYYGLNPEIFNKYLSMELRAMNSLRISQKERHAKLSYRIPQKSQCYL